MEKINLAYMQARANIIASEIRNNSNNVVNSSHVLPVKSIHERKIDVIEEAKSELSQQRSAIEAYKKTCVDNKDKGLNKTKHISFRV